MPPYIWFQFYILFIIDLILSFVIFGFLVVDADIIDISELKILYLL